MKKIFASAAIAALSLGGVAVAATGTATAATTPSSQDVTWMKSNAQTDMAEISLGTLVESESTNADTLNLAKVTKSQHETVLTKLKTLAKTAGVTLPTSPNSMQLAQAATLKTESGYTFDLTYAKDQIAGHEMSISQTNTEISSGSDPAVISFAKYYLPIAEMHLSMSRTLDSELTSSSGAAATPSGAVTGTGGGADRLSPGDDVLIGLILLGAAGAVVTARRLVKA